MDKDDSANLDVEYIRYLQMLKPYLGQLLDPEDIQICNTWIQRLSGCEEIEKIRRNKYLFTLCFQLANGILTHPFTSPPPKELPMLFDEVNSDDSFSEAEAHINTPDQNNIEILSNNTNSIIQNIFRSARSDVSISTEKVESILDNSKDIHIFKNQLKNEQSTSNSTIDNNLFYMNFSKDLLPEDNVYLRVNNLIDKLREMKKQNTMLHKELQAMKENNNRKYLPTQNLKPSVHCGTNTEASENYSCDCQSYMYELKRESEKNNHLKLLEVAELKREHEAEMIKLKTSLQEDVQENYEKIIQAIRNEYDLNINNIKSNTETEINKLTTSLNEIKAEKENMLVLKNQEIDNLKIELEEVKAHNSELRNSFIKASNDYSPGKINERALEFEKKLYKMEKVKNKRVKAYQAQLASLHYNKNLLDSSFHLQLLKQRTEIISDFTHENQKELSATVEKLENKYKEIVANVQAAAIQGRIQDQVALETIIRTVFDKRNNLTRADEGSHNVVNIKSMGNVDNGNGNGNLLSALHTRRKGKNLIEKKMESLEDTLPSGFCMDEIKLEELFERVHIPQKDTDVNQSLP